MTTQTDNDPAVWFVRVGKDVFGPYPLRRVRAFIREGRIRAHTRVRIGGSGSFTPAAESPVLGPLLRIGQGRRAGAPAPKDMGRDKRITREAANLVKAVAPKLTPKPERTAEPAPEAAKTNGSAAPTDAENTTPRADTPVANTPLAEAPVAETPAPETPVRATPADEPSPSEEAITNPSEAAKRIQALLEAHVAEDKPLVAGAPLAPRREPGEPDEPALAADPESTHDAHPELDPSDLASPEERPDDQPSDDGARADDSAPESGDGVVEKPVAERAPRTGRLFGRRRRARAVESEPPAAEDNAPSGDDAAQRDAGPSAAVEFAASLEYEPTPLEELDSSAMTEAPEEIVAEIDDAEEIDTAPATVAPQEIIQERPPALIGETSNFLIVAQLRTTGEAAVEGVLAEFGPAVQASSGVWFIRAATTCDELRNAVSRKLGGRDTLIVVDASKDEAAWFNIGADRDNAIRLLRDKTAEAA